MLENLAAGVFIIAFVWLGIWLIDRVGAYSKTLDCMQYRNINSCK